MAAHPGRIADVIDVPFGRTRGPMTKRDPRFAPLVDELADALA